MTIPVQFFAAQSAEGTNILIKIEDSGEISADELQSKKQISQLGIKNIKEIGVADIDPSLRTLEFRVQSGAVQLIGDSGSKLRDSASRVGQAAGSAIKEEVESAIAELAEEGTKAAEAGKVEKEKPLRYKRPKARALRTIGKVAFTALSIILAPITLIVTPILSMMLLDKVLLPAAYMGKDEIPTLPEPDIEKGQYSMKVETETDDGTKYTLDGRIQFAEGVAKEDAQNLPTVVLFFQNATCYEHKNTLKLAAEYNRKGFNVVMFNYRGVSESGKTADGTKVRPKSGTDLAEDGLAVVNKLVEEGFELEEGVRLQPKKENVLLDGSSIGGSVAIAVGQQYPEMKLAANRTFTTWADAAEGLVRKYSNPVYAKMVKGIYSLSSRARINNLKKLKERTGSEDRSFTLIESAGRTGDQTLTRRSKLHEMHAKEGIEIENFPHLDHNDYMKLEERTVWHTNVIEPHATQVYEPLKTKFQIMKRAQYITKLLGTMHRKFEEDKANSTFINENLNAIKGSLDLVFEELKKLEKPELINDLMEELNIMLGEDFFAVVDENIEKACAKLSESIQESTKKALKELNQEIQIRLDELNAKYKEKLEAQRVERPPGVMVFKEFEEEV